LKEALLTHLDFKTNELIIEQYGQVQKKHSYYQLLYSFSEQVLAYSYAMKNLTSVNLELSLDLSGTEKMVTSCDPRPTQVQNKKKSGKVERQGEFSDEPAS